MSVVTALLFMESFDVSLKLILSMMDLYRLGYFYTQSLLRHLRIKSVRSGIHYQGTPHDSKSRRRLPPNELGAGFRHVVLLPQELSLLLIVDRRP